MKIDQAIRSGRWPNASTLGKDLEVTSRTVRRDIVFLRDRLKAPVEFDRVRNGYFYREPSYVLPLAQVTEGELVAVLLAERLVRQYQGTPFERQLRQAFERMTLLLPETVSIRLDSMANCLAVLPSVQTTLKPEIFETLAKASAERRTVEMNYWTAGRNESSVRRFDPYTLMLREEQWYAVGYCHNRREVRVFALPRILALQIGDDPFDRPADFDIERYMEGSFRALRGDGTYPIALRFNAAFAGRIREKTWHPSQSIEAFDDGTVILRFELSDLREIKRWVMFWGTDCEVLEPNELKELVLQEYRSLSKMSKKQ